MPEITKKNELKLQLIDNYVPLLDPDDYTIVVEQTTRGAGDKPEHDLDESFSRSQLFTVSGPRFTLPADDVHSVYPPRNSQGHFAYDLPHIVLNNRAIPWERNIWGADEHTIPWLALLVLGRSEILDPTVGTNKIGPTDKSHGTQNEVANSVRRANPAGTTTITIHELLNPIETNVATPNLTMESTMKEHIEPKSVTCQVFDIAPATFKRVALKKTELPYFAHCRRVEIFHKADNPKLHPDRDHIDKAAAWYSVIIASRFPTWPKTDATPEATVVHLVSLEGYADYFNNPDKTYFSGQDRVRLVSLYSWSFTCQTARNESFAALMHNLVTDDTRESPKKADNMLLRPPLQKEPETPDETVAYKALQTGYTATSFQTRQGEKTFGWYRGPFTPELPSPLPSDRPAPFLRASQAMIYDPNYGVFDQSYSVAFETGRLMALSNNSFSTNLLNWRRQIQRAIDLLAERTNLDEALKGALFDHSAQANFRLLLEQGLLTRSFLTHLTVSFSEDVAPIIHDNNTTMPDVTQIMPQDVDAGNPSVMALKNIFAEHDIRHILEEIGNEVLEPIITWLARLYLLYEVPFANLVADNRMLPKESIRFFYVDRNWLEVMLEGAMSLGIHHSRDELFSVITSDFVLEEVYKLIHTVRDMMLGISTVTPDDAGSGAFAGMLLRSAVVSGWPGMEVHAYHEVNVNPDVAGSEEPFVQSANRPMNLLRLSKLSDDVLLCLFPAVPAWIEIDQPKEGLHFGAQVNDDNQLVIYPRHVEGPNTGKLIQGQGNEIPIVINKDTRCLELTNSTDGFLNAIKTSLDLNRQPGPAEFSMQMIYAPQSMVFQNTVFRSDS